LLEVYELAADRRYLEAARRNLEWTLAQQRANGWFANNALFVSENKWSLPFTHTIAYVMEGLQEAFRILRDVRYLAAYSRTSEKLLQIYDRTKELPGDFDENWVSTSNYTCLTGNAQIAGVWLKHFELTGDARYMDAAASLIRSLKGSQNLLSSHCGVRGGIKGSLPVNGKYTPYIFPNWAANSTKSGQVRHQGT
jgi:uncharacterized protein YyaL (SSP411 family)